jgi:hypothetical protein
MDSHLPSSSSAAHVSFGRVEDGRGSLGPMANAPSPIGRALEAQNAEFSMNDIECKSTIAAPLHLVPSREEPAHSFKDVLVDATVCLAPRAVAEVVGPASQ